MLQKATFSLTGSATRIEVNEHPPEQRLRKVLGWVSFESGLLTNSGKYGMAVSLSTSQVGGDSGVVVNPQIHRRDIANASVAIVQCFGLISQTHHPARARFS